MRAFNLVLALFAILAVFFSQTSNAVSPGLITGMNTNGILQIANSIIPKAIAAVKEFDIPDFSGKHGIIKYSVSNIRFKTLSLESFVCNPVGNSIQVGIKGLNSHVALKWSYKSKVKVPYGSGTADVYLSSKQSTITLAVLNRNNAQGQPRPYVQVNSTDLSLDNFSIKVHGSLISFLYNLIISAFKGTIRRTIESTVTTTLKTTIDTVGNQILSTLPMSKPLSNWGILTYALTSSMYYSGSTAMIGFDFETLNTSSQSDSSIPRHSLSLTPKGRMFEGVMDSFVINSACNTYFKSGQFTRSFEESNRPSYFPITLNTANWILIPELQATYPNQPMRATISFSEKPSISITPGKLTFNGYILLALQVRINNQWTPVLTVKTGVSSSGGFSIVMENGNPVFKLQLNNVTPTFSIVQSTIQKPNFDGIVKIFTNITNSYIIPLINSLIFAGFPIPSVAGLTLSNAEFSLIQDAVYFGTDVSFTF